MPCSVEAWFSSSGTATTEASAVILVIEMVLLVSGGITSRTACGMITNSSVRPNGSPVERPASYWPRCTDTMPAQKISSDTAARLRISVRVAHQNGSRFTPA